MPDFILSPCGTSILTGNAPSDMERKCIAQNSNKKEDEISGEDLHILKKRIENVRQMIMSAPLRDVARMSAELNALCRYYDFDPNKGNRDQHYLLSTDTWLGRQTAGIIKDRLMHHGIDVQIYAPRDLQTSNLEGYRWALADVVRWIDDIVPGYQKEGYKIIFNLTGGFKSVQGFLQTLAMIYADETIYVFETQEQLFRLPRLPVTFTPDKTVRENFDVFRRVNMGESVELPAHIPELMFFKLDDQHVLSELGAIHYAQTRKELYRQRLYPPACNKVKFGKKFEKSVRNLPPDRLYLVNERIEDLCRYLISGGNKHIKRLDLKALQGNPRPPYTHEMDAWSDRDARRIYCRFDRDVCILEELDKGLH